MRINHPSSISLRKQQSTVPHVKIWEYAQLSAIAIHIQFAGSCVKSDAKHEIMLKNASTNNVNISNRDVSM